MILVWLPTVAGVVLGYLLTRRSAPKPIYMDPVGTDTPTELTNLGDFDALR